jgi:uncharacterized protein YigE (DUF2233 family)
VRLITSLLVILLAACRSDATVADPQRSQSVCDDRYFEQSRFTVCAVRSGTVEIVNSDPAGVPIRSFVRLEQLLGGRSKDLAFAMNAGMFDENGRAIGLLIEKSTQLHKVNRHSGGGGNFGMLPNGIFLVRDSGRAEIITTDNFQPSADIAYATQSGPMLVIDGKLHPRFDPDGQSRNIRNGVGIGPDGRPLFVISEDAVSFGKLARFFRDSLKANNALYFDGSVSSLWDPATGRQDSFTPLGPMIVVFKAAASAPGP